MSSYLVGRKLTAKGALIGVNNDSAWAIQENGFLTLELWESRVAPFVCHHIRSHSDMLDWHVLVLDGVGSHTMSPKAMRCFLENRILVVKMPSHTSADLQPLDKSVFHPVKEQVRSEIRRFTLDTVDRVLDQWQLPQLLDSAWWKAATESTIRAGFKKCGIYPLNTNWVFENDDIFSTSISFNQHTEVKRMEDALTTTALGPTRFPMNVTTLHYSMSMLTQADLVYCACVSKVFNSEIKYYLRRKCSPVPELLDHGIVQGDLQVSDQPAEQGADINGLPSLSTLRGIDGAEPGPATLSFARDCTIDKSLAIMRAAQVPFVQERILNKAALLSKLTDTVAAELNIQRELAQTAIISSCDLASRVLQHMKTPLAVKASLDNTLGLQEKRISNTRKRLLNVIGESHSEPSVLNEEKRIEQLEANEDRKRKENEIKQSKKQRRCELFIREAPLVQKLHLLHIIEWNTNDEAAFAAKRMLTKHELLAFVDSQQLRDFVRANTGKTASACKREELVISLLAFITSDNNIDREPMQPLQGFVHRTSGNLKCLLQLQLL